MLTEEEMERLQKELQEHFALVNLPRVRELSAQMKKERVTK